MGDGGTYTGASAGRRENDAPNLSECVRTVGYQSAPVQVASGPAILADEGVTSRNADNGVPRSGPSRGTTDHQGARFMYTQKARCTLCGAEMTLRHCKLVCTRQGCPYFEDCSDL